MDTRESHAMPFDKKTNLLPPMKLFVGLVQLYAIAAALAFMSLDSQALLPAFVQLLFASLVVLSHRQKAVSLRMAIS
jgi:hypothetical protein